MRIGDGFRLKKKAAALLLAAAVPRLAAKGVGPQIYETSSAAGAAFTMALDRLPVCLEMATEFDAHDGCLTVRLAGSWRVMNPVITGNWKWYWEPGVSADAAFFTDDVRVGVQGRLTAGMSWTYCDGFTELFVQQTVETGPGLYLGDGSLTWIAPSFPLGAGVRFWF